MTYELINGITANTLATFNTRHAAEAALEQMRAENHSLARAVEIVAFDDEGLALEEEEPSPGGGEPAVPAPSASRARVRGALERERKRDREQEREPERV